MRETETQNKWSMFICMLDDDDPDGDSLFPPTTFLAPLPSLLLPLSVDAWKHITPYVESIVLPVELAAA